MGKAGRPERDWMGEIYGEMGFHWGKYGEIMGM